MNYPLAFTNNSTIFANETNLSYFSTPRPLSSRLGAFFYPKHSPVKNFRKFFQPKVGELFSIFMVRKIMGVKGTCRSGNRGGCPSFMPFLHIAKGLPSCLPSSSLVVNFQSIGANFQQKVAKVNIYLLDFVSPREFRRQQTAKSKHIFVMWLWCVVSCAPLVVVSTGCRRCAPAPSLWVCSVPFSLPLPSFPLSFPALPFKYALFGVSRAFLAGFGVRMYVCMG